MDEIVIESKRVDENTVKSSLQVPDRIKKYIKTPELFVIYDKEVTDNESILNIPLASNVLPLAWLTDCDIHVDSIDKRYRESMTLLREEINKIFPVKQFKTNINAVRLVENHVQTEGTGLLFSGGVDSTYSMIINWDKHPHLIMVWGIDMHPYPEYRPHWEELEAIYSGFAERNGLEFSMIKTNASQILDEKRINHDFYRELQGYRIRMRHQHTLIVVPLLAPLSTNRFNEILYAASSWHTFPYKKRSTISLPWIDEKIFWADLTTKHDGFIHRNDKFPAISEFMKDHELILKVCHKPELNCCLCEKCYRTIINLVLQGIDPNDCGFNVNEETFKDMRSYYEKATVPEHIITICYESLKRMIQDNTVNEINGSKEFLHWFKDSKLNSNVKENKGYRAIYNKLPYSLASTYHRFIRKAGIDIQVS